MMSLERQRGFFTMPGGMGAAKPGGTSVVYATWNPSDKGTNVALSNSDLTATGSGGSGVARATVSKTTGKYYYEAVVTTNVNSSNTLVGVANGAASLAGPLSTANNSTIVFRYDGIVFRGSSNLGDLGANNVDGDIIMIGVDIDNGRFYVGRNGTWLNSADPGAGTGSLSFTPSGAIYPAVNVANGGVWTARFNPSSFSYSVPSGFSAWSS